MKEYRVSIKKMFSVLVLLAVLCLLNIGIADVGGYAQTGIDRFTHGYESQLTGDPAYDIVTIALAQINRTGQSLGYFDGDWCAAFVVDCAKYAGVSNLIPFESGRTHGVGGAGGYAYLYERMLAKGATAVSTNDAKRGDIVFFGGATGGNFTHVGIMVDNVNTVEGNLDGYGTNPWLQAKVKTYVRTGRYNRVVVLRPKYGSTDTIKPTISNIKISEVTSLGYTVTCDVSDNKGVTKVAFPTWTEWNGQDDLASTWPSVTVSSGANQTKTVSYTVKTSDHYGEVGTYITHIYAYDAAGNTSNVTQSNYSCLRFDIVDKLPNRYTLPKNLKQIDDEAFANTGIQVATIPDATTKIGSKAFPSDIVVYWKKSIARSIASDAMPGVRVFDTTQYTEWSAWSGWSKTRQTITDSNLKQEESRTVYPYYAFVCQTCGFHSPYWGSSANHNHTINSGDFRVNVDNITTPKSGCTQYNSIKYETTYNGEKWYYWDDSSAPQPYTQYRYRTRQVQ